MYDRYGKPVCGLALAILGSRQEAEDLTQEVFLTVYEHTGYDPGRGSVSAFLTTMTRSRAIDRLRRRGRSVRLLRTWHEATPPARGPFTPLERVSMQQCSDRVRAALGALPQAGRPGRVARGGAAGARARLLQGSQSGRDRRRSRYAARDRQEPFPACLDGAQAGPRRSGGLTA